MDAEKIKLQELMDHASSRNAVIIHMKYSHQEQMHHWFAKLVHAILKLKYLRVKDCVRNAKHTPNQLVLLGRDTSLNVKLLHAQMVISMDLMDHAESAQLEPFQTQINLNV